MCIRDSRLANPSNVRLELRFGDGTVYTPTEVYICLLYTSFGINYVKMSGLDDLTGGSYKCYCITYILTGLVLVNGAIYG